MHTLHKRIWRKSKRVERSDACSYIPPCNEKPECQVEAQEVNMYGMMWNICNGSGSSSPMNGRRAKHNGSLFDNCIIEQTEVLAVAIKPISQNSDIANSIGDDAQLTTPLEEIKNTESAGVAKITDVIESADQSQAPGQPTTRLNTLERLGYIAEEQAQIAS